MEKTTRASSEPVSRVDPEPQPLQLPGYEILGSLGQGGMGAVFRARQVALDRIVALKVVLGGQMARAEDLARFREEAESIARLQHPNLVTVYESGVHSGTPYLAMELVEGGTLFDRLTREGRLPPAESARLIEQLARALHAVHQRGIVHRDLKPANILINTEGVPKIADFGLAKRTEQSSTPGATPRPNLTEPGFIVGTPTYMSPEQAMGKSEVGPASDIYSLGVLMYECLTGRPPFRGDTAWEVMDRIIRDEPIPARRIAPALPHDLETICLKCLAKQPAARYQDGRELADDLARYLAGEPIEARRTPFWERLWMWARRHPAIAALSLFSMCSMVALVLASVRYHALIQTSLHQNQQRLVQLSVLQGTRALDEEHTFLGLAWFVEALKLEMELGGNDHWHRVRIGTILRTAPRLVGQWVQSGPVRVAIADPGERLLLLGGDGGEVRLYELRTGKPASRPINHATSVTAGLFVDGGKRIVIGCADGTVNLHDLASEKATLLGAHSEAIVSLATLATPDEGSALFSASRDGTGQVRILKNGQLRLTIAHGSKLLAADATANGKYLATCGEGLVRLWNGQTGKCLADLAHPGAVRDVRFDLDGNYLATGCSDGGVRLFDCQGKQVFHKRMHRDAVVQVRFDAQGKRLISSSDDATARIWSVPQGEPICGPLTHGSGVNAAVFSRDGRRVATASDDNTAWVWDADTGENVSPSLWHTGSVFHVCFGHDSRFVLSAGNDSMARLWDLKPPMDPLSPVPLVGQPPVSTTGPWKDATGQVSVVIEGDHDARLIDARTGASWLLRHGSPVQFALFQSDGKRVATFADDNLTRIWDVKTGNLVGRPLQHGGTVRFATFSRDGQMLFTSSRDTTARLWEVEKGQPLTPVWRPGSRIRELVIAEQGDRVSALLEGDKTPHTWDLLPDNQSLEVLQRLALLLTGRKVDGKYGLLPVPGCELVAPWEQTHGKEKE